MASMNRNLNLEEVNTDAFMGIPFLKYQTFAQKALFVISLIASVVILLIGVFAFEINVNLLILLTLLPMGFGIAFGCNYNQDLSLIKYLQLVLFKPSVKLVTRPTEDIEQIRNSANRIRQEEELRRRKEQQASPAEQKKRFLKLMLILAVAAAALLSFVIVTKSLRHEEIHHTVEQINIEAEVP